MGVTCLTVGLQSEVLLILLFRKLWLMCFRCRDICYFPMPTNYIIAEVSSVTPHLTMCAIKLTISTTTTSSTSTISTTSSSSLSKQYYHLSYTSSESRIMQVNHSIPAPFLFIYFKEN